MKDFDWFTFLYYVILILGITAYFLAIPWIAQYY